MTCSCYVLVLVVLISVDPSVSRSDCGPSNLIWVIKTSAVGENKDQILTTLSRIIDITVCVT